MLPNLDLKQGISYLERERGREIREIDRKIEGRGSETDDNKNPEQSWVAQLVYIYKRLLPRKKKSATQKNKEPQEQFFFEIEHQTS